MRSSAAAVVLALTLTGCAQLPPFVRAPAFERDGPRRCYPHEWNVKCNGQTEEVE